MQQRPRCRDAALDVCAQLCFGPATATCYKLQEAQATVAQDDQDQRAADEASKLTQPLSQRLRQHSGDEDGEEAPEPEAAAAGGSEQGMVSPEQAPAGQGVSIDTSTDVSAIAPAMKMLWFQARRTRADTPLQSP